MRTPSLVASASTTDTGVTSQDRDDIMLSLDSIWRKRNQMNSYISSVSWLTERGVCSPCAGLVQDLSFKVVSVYTYGCF